MSTENSPARAQRLAQLLSLERMSKLLALTGDEAAAVSLHQDTLALNCAMMKIVATLEIALRNTVYTNIAMYCGSQSWLQAPPIKLVILQHERKAIERALETARRSEYSKLSHQSKVALKAAVLPHGRPKNMSYGAYVKAKRSPIQVSDGKIIAELTMNFWKTLFGGQYEHHVWKPTLKRVFPNRSLKRSVIATHLEVIYQTRNRLAHHEPVLHGRFAAAMASIQLISNELSVDSSLDENPLAALIAGDCQHVFGLETALAGRLNSYRTQGPAN